MTNLNYNKLKLKNKKKKWIIEDVRFTLWLIIASISMYRHRFILSYYILIISFKYVCIYKLLTKYIIKGNSFLNSIGFIYIVEPRLQTGTGNDVFRSVNGYRKEKHGNIVEASSLYSGYSARLPEARMFVQSSSEYI